MPPNQSRPSLIRVKCQDCGFGFKVEARFAGKQGTCPNPKCRGVYVVPVANTADKKEPATSRSQNSPRETHQVRNPSPSETDPPRRLPFLKTGVAAAATLLIVSAVVVLAALGRSAEQGEQQALAAAQKKQTAKPEQDVFKTYVQPFVKKYCFDCHGAKDPQAELGLHVFKDEKSMLKERKKWEKVLSLLEVQVMPPLDHEPLPTAAERKAVVDWLQTLLYNIDCTKVRDPGRVTIRRLNRVEYNNTIRDLLGVDFQPAADFPSDDVGEGFDNIGDVLSISPLLMEKYLDAAEKITDKAIETVDPSKSAKQRFAANKLKASGNGGRNNGGSYGLYSQGEVFADAKFPRKGEYILRAEAEADQAGPELAKMEVRLGGRKIKVFDVKGKRTAKVYEVKLNVDGGTKKIAAAFINDYYMPKAKNPKDRDRNLYIRYLEVQGPVDVKPSELPGSHTRIIASRPGGKRSVRDCARENLGKFATRAFRRPVKNEELDRLVKLVELAVEQGDNFEQGMQLAVQAALVSPHFLFRVEQDRQPADPKAVRSLTDYELASRLSYFLWSSMPDAELFELAEKGTLHRPDVLQQQARRLLNDPKSKALVDNFAIQWLNLANLDELSPDPKRFPTFNDKLRADMRRETELFFEAVMREDRSILDLLDGNFTFVNKRLAQHYGISGVSGEKFQKVTANVKQRAGVLTHASILTITSNPTRTSPVKRGKWILENILGTPPPEPPADVPDLAETAKAAKNASLREQLELHRRDPKCAVCHRKMDALGFGFENFDAIGRWRDRDGKHSINASATLPGGVTFSGPVELVRILKKRKLQFSRSLTQKMLTYALGRGLEFYDRCTVDKIIDALAKNDYRFSTLVLEIVKSEPFRRRRGDGEQE